MLFRTLAAGKCVFIYCRSL